MPFRKPLKTKDQIDFDFERKPTPAICQLLSPQEFFDSCDEILLRQSNETSRLEKKSAGIHPKDLSEYFSMWANTQPNGGIIVVGITKDRTFEGCLKLSSKQQNRIEQTADTYCPDANYKVKNVRITRDIDKAEDFVIVFLVEYHTHRVVGTTDNRFFVRRGSSKHEVKGEELRHLRAEKGEIRLEVEPCDLRYPQDFDLKAIDAFSHAVHVGKKWLVPHNREEVLSIMHLGVISEGSFSPNVAMALLFAKDPRLVIPGSRIRFLRFPGETEGTGPSWNAVKDEFIEGTLPSQIQQIEQILKSQLRSFSPLGAGGKFNTSSEYPEFCWYEAIVNACVHRSYGNGMKNMNIFVKMFDDRLLIESPGGFMPFVTPQNIYTKHSPRNPFLMDAMFYFEFVKCGGEGTKRMRDQMREMELPEPEFKQDDIEGTIVRVTLRNKIKQRRVWVDSDVIEIIGTRLASLLSEDEKQCINFIAERGEISVSDAQRLTKMHWPAASRMLKQLAEKGILVHDRKEGVERDTRARFRLREANIKQ